jgi:predicted RNase H-like HicB family nuclease
MNVRDYLNLPYRLSISETRDGRGSHFSITVYEFDGCTSEGDTYEEAKANIKKAMKVWIKTKLENGFTVPEPEPFFMDIDWSYIIGQAERRGARRANNQKALKIARNMLALGDSPERVAKATELPLAKVKALLKTTKVKQSA